MKITSLPYLDFRLDLGFFAIGTEALHRNYASYDLVWIGVRGRLFKWTFHCRLYTPEISRHRSLFALFGYEKQIEHYKEARLRIARIANELLDENNMLKAKLASIPPGGTAQ